MLPPTDGVISCHANAALNVNEPCHKAVFAPRTDTEQVGTLRGEVRKLSCWWADASAGEATVGGLVDMVISFVLLKTGEKRTTLKS